MPLGDPPDAAGSLSDLPSFTLEADRSLHRVWRRDLPDGTTRDDFWWFASVPDEPRLGGRFDLPAPMGTCYTSTSAVGAVLETLQHHLTSLPRAELQVRRRAELLPLGDVPPAADLTAQQATGSGITAALWAGRDRPLTQAWAAALRRDGWWLLHGGIQHDPSGRLRAVTLFDHAGAHPPSYGKAWVHAIDTLHDDDDLLDELADYGIEVHDPGDLPFVDPPS